MSVRLVATVVRRQHPMGHRGGTMPVTSDHADENGCRAA